MFKRDAIRGTTTPEIETTRTEAGAEPSVRDEMPPGRSPERASRQRFLCGWFSRGAAVLAEVAVAFLIREVVAHRHPGFAPFITFYPAVLLASLLDGMWAGVAVTALATLVAQIWIFAPSGSLEVRDPYDILSLG